MTFQMSGGLPYELRERLLTIDNVSVAYGETPVLQKVSAHVDNIVRPGMQQGQVVSILGPSGVGKSTLFGVMSGLLTPDSGNVLIGPKQTPVVRGTIGVVSQHYPLFEHYTVRQNLLAAAKISRKGAKDAAERTDRMLETFDLAKQRSHYPMQLSGGQRQRAAVAQQLLESNLVLLMDEPFSGQDLMRLYKTCDVIRTVAQLDELFTIVIVTHDIGAALTVSDTIWVMGRVSDMDKRPLGAQIVRTFDLMERGLAWQSDNRALPAFADARREIESLFPSL